MQRRENYEKKYMTKNTDAVSMGGKDSGNNDVLSDLIVTNPYSVAPAQHKEWKWPKFDDNK